MNVFLNQSRGQRACGGTDPENSVKEDDDRRAGRSACAGIRQSPPVGERQQLFFRDLFVHLDGTCTSLGNVVDTSVRTSFMQLKRLDMGRRSIDHCPLIVSQRSDFSAPQDTPQRICHQLNVSSRLDVAANMTRLVSPWRLRMRRRRVMERSRIPNDSPTHDCESFSIR